MRGNAALPMELASDGTLLEAVDLFAGNVELPKDIHGPY